MKKKIIAMAAAFTLLGSSVCHAYTFPHAFWAMNDSYQQAVDSGNEYGVIDRGNSVINLISGEPECTETNNVLADRMQRVAQAYAATGQYAASADMWQRFIPYGERVGWTDSIIIANAKIPQYRSQTRVYTSGWANTYFGAKNEPANGVLFGLCTNGETRSRLGNESMVLMYHELGESVPWYIDEAMADAAEKGLAVEYALNCPNEAGDISNIRSMEWCLSEISALLNKYPNTPVYLRFGAEFNVWSYEAAPEAYADAFRYVADFFHSRNQNVAMVWSPNQVSGWDKDMNVFYPGDEYVDWIGVSLYSMPYFQGSAPDNDYTELVFQTGKGADPVLAIKKIVDTYGDRKPIMVAESGFSHTQMHTGENTSAWAMQKMKEFYSYLPMVYPQVKLIAYFDNYVSPETNDFRLSSNYALAEQYIEMTKWPRFIQDGHANTTSFAYSEVTDGKTLSNMCDLYTYTHLFDEDITSVSYYIDGVQVGSSNKMPFACYVDLRQFENGSHTLKTVSAGSRGGIHESSRTVNIQNTAEELISVTMNGAPLSFDQNPLVYSGRTMVPMRAIFDAMGAQIDWNDSTKTVTGTKDGTTVSITIGSNILTVNGTPVTLDVPAILMSGRTLVPARAIAESFSCTVGWDGNTKTVTITP